VRIRLLKNQRAGQIMEQVKWFHERRLQIHAQVVVCPGINDGVHLERTIRDLASFYRGEVPAVASVAVVPVGLTRFRPEKDELTPVIPQKAQEIITQVRSLQQEFRHKYQTNFVWLADEWFLIAGAELPSEKEYEEYPQIDNGVGSIRLFLKQFEETAAELLPKKVSPRKLTWVVGNAVEVAFQPIVKRLNDVEGLEVHMRAICSDYWGQAISVTGLITGHDLLLNLQEQDLGDAILLPNVMLKHSELVFLDDITVEEVSCKLKTKILPVSGVEGLIANCTK
jgi:putative radical SAM enzyme (TIGR03279 family)